MVAERYGGDDEDEQDVVTDGGPQFADLHVFERSTSTTSIRRRRVSNSAIGRRPRRR